MQVTTVTEVDKGEEDSRDKVTSGVSDGAATASASIDNEDQEPAGSAAKPLPLCPYGKNCYR